MAEANSASDHSLLWGYALEFWDRVGIISLIVGAILGVLALLLTAASAYILYRVADTAQLELAAETKSSSELIAGLNRETARLAAEGEASRQKIAEANARAAEAQLALEKFRAPRSLTALQQGELRERLLPFAGTIARVWTMPAGSPDTAGLADLLIHVLEQANWSVGRATSLSGKSFPGVVVTYRNGSDAAPQTTALVEYLNSVGVSATMAQPFDDEGGLMPASNMVSPAGIPNIVVVVGSKT